MESNKGFFRGSIVNKNSALKVNFSHGMSWRYLKEKSPKKNTGVFKQEEKQHFLYQQWQCLGIAAYDWILYQKRLL